MMVLIKAVGLAADLLPEIVPVKGHARGPLLVLPHTAIRHKAIEAAPNQLKPLMVTMKPAATEPGTAESEPSIERDAMIEGSRRLPNG